MEDNAKISDIEKKYFTNSDYKKFASAKRDTNKKKMNYLLNLTFLNSYKTAELNA